MKKFAVSVIICFLLVLPTISNGASDMYGSFNAGVVMGDDENMKSSGGGSADLKYDTGFTVGGAIGYRLGETGDYRVEGEVAYQNNEVDRIENNSTPVDLMEASMLTFLLNGYIDFNYGSAFSWFVTAGFGFARIDGEMTAGGVTDDENDTVLAYQAGVGVGYAVTETVTLDCRYRYLGTDDPDFGGVEIGVPNQNITVGIRVAF